MKSKRSLNFYEIKLVLKNGENLVKISLQDYITHQI